MARVNDETKAQTRRALLSAAAQAFAERGYERTGIDAVSEAAGLAKGTIYNYFSSKEEVFHTLLREACALAAKAADRTPPDASTRTRLEAFVSANLSWARRHKPLALVFARELLAGDAATRSLILEGTAPCVRKVAEIIEDGIECGELATTAPVPDLALTFIMLANMLLLQGSAARRSWPSPAELPAAAAELFLSGIAG